jgi:TM2 domain-containing membrane protein YozV
MKKSIKITLLLSVFSLSLFAAQPYKVKKCKHKLVQSPRVIVADVDVPKLPTVEPTKELIEDKEEVKTPSVTTAKVSKTSIKAVDLSLVSSSYVPTAKQLKKAKRLQKRLNKTSDDFPIANNQVIAIGLCFFFLFIHRLYLGYYGIAILQLLTLGGFGIWWLIDLIRLFTGDLKPKNGDYDFTI